MSAWTAGGTDLLGCLRDQVLAADTLVSLSAIEGLAGVRELEDGGLAIGAMTTIAEVAEHPAIRRLYPGLAQAAAQITRALAVLLDRGLIDAALQALGLKDAFDHLQSGSELEYGKPHPLVYLVTAGKLKVPSKECLALEDSIPGLISAKAARMKAIAVPEPRLFGDPRFSIADVTLKTLKELNDEVWAQAGFLA